VRFYSKLVSDDEWIEHVRDYRSCGSDNPSVNYNFVKTQPNSFERLRMSCFERQSVVNADLSGGIVFNDMSLNNINMSGFGFGSLSQCYRGQVVNVSTLSTKIDEFTTDSKVRVRGYVDPINIQNDPTSNTAPVYDISYMRPSDDARFSVDVSLVDALNRDIVTTLSSLNTMSNDVGNANLRFCLDYPDLEKLQDVYFNRLTSKLDFRKFFDFYRWFDESISTFIEQLIPKKTKYRGMNLVVEPHFLERHKLEYHGEDTYVNEANKRSLESVLLLQQVVGTIGRF